MVHLYGPEVGADRVRRIMHLLAAYPYLLRHHVRKGCLCENDEESVQPKEYRLKLREPTYAGVVDTRYEGAPIPPVPSSSSSGDSCPVDSATATPKSVACWVDRRKLPWRLFDRASLKKVARSQNRPLWVLDRVARELVSVPYGPNFTSRERLSLLGQVDKLTNAIGQCERIHQTAVPLNYARHSLRSLTIWLFTLPFAVVKDLGMLTPFVTAVSAWLLFGVYQIGYSIEDPFQGSLRLSILCDSIRKDVLGVAEDVAESGRESAYKSGGADVSSEQQQQQLWADLDLPSTTSTRRKKRAGASSSTVSTEEVLADILANPPKFVIEGSNVTSMEDAVGVRSSSLLR